jgi:TolB-like protein
MVSGRRPFHAPSETALIATILRCSPAPLPSIGTGAQTVSRVIKKCLVKEPDRRWQSFEGIVDLLTSSRTAPKSRAKPAAAPQKTGVRSMRRLAVLPFENLSPSTLEEYVPEGLTDALTSALSLIRPLRVISRTSLVRIDARDLAAVARTLAVDGVIRGSVSGSAERVEARVELVSVPAGDVLWSEAYDSPLDDVLRAQKDIASTMAITLQLTLTPSDRRRSVAAAWSRDRAANEAYLRGRYFLDRVTLDALRRSFQYLSTAVQKDPTHGRAYAALCRVVRIGCPVPARGARRGAAAVEGSGAQCDQTRSDAGRCAHLPRADSRRSSGI